MVIAKNRLFFVIGGDFVYRQRALQNLISKTIKQDAAFNSIRVYFDRHTRLEYIQELVLRFSFGKEKVILFKNVDKMHNTIAAFLEKNLAKILEFNYLIFEVDRNADEFYRDRTLKKQKSLMTLLHKATVLRIKSVFKETVSLWSLMRAVHQKRLDTSLYIVDRLFSSSREDKRILGTKILGYLVSGLSDLADASYKKRCFNLLWETDRLLKRGNVESKLALQSFLVKLFSD